MCGRFAFHSPLTIIEEKFKVETVTCELTPRYNISPMENVPVIIDYDGRRLGLLKWGFVPSWVKDFNDAKKMINARAETVDSKPSFKNAFRKRRCIIPADGFYEWKKEGGAKKPYYFFLPSKEPFAFAGIWENWKDLSGHAYHSFAILTTEASESVKPLHDRMPVILSSRDINSWLDTDNNDSAIARSIITERNIKDIFYYPVSPKMNNGILDDKTCIEPV